MVVNIEQKLKFVFVPEYAYTMTWFMVSPIVLFAINS